ncbi:MAG: Crp/Fnr family transcriptional regulator [Myxococcaceae bacterium]|nr:Crp/Fnr family transcriptional regulator [Myxococcaceae bacterium]
MAADATLLSNVPLFERLDDDERGLLAAQIEGVDLPAGATVFKRGDPGDSIFIVASGEVEIFVLDTTGQRIVFETAKAGDFFGELSLLDGDPRSASAVAIQDTRALRIDRNDLSLLFTRHPTAALDVLSVIGRRLREADKLIGTRVIGSPNEAVEERLTPVQRIADFAAAFSGTFSFLLMHVVWFAVWVGINTGLVKGMETFDPYPFGLLTMVVSLEAIFLSCMVLISQSRQAVKDRIRSDVEYDANIRAGLEVTQLHVKVDQLYEQVLARLAAVERQLHPAAIKPLPAKPSGSDLPRVP